MIETMSSTSERIENVRTGLPVKRTSAPEADCASNVSPSSPDVRSRGDVARALPEADVVGTGRYTTPCVLHSTMEPHGVMAEWQEDQLIVHEGTQGVFAVRDEVDPLVYLNGLYGRVS